MRLVSVFARRDAHDPMKRCAEGVFILVADHGGDGVDAVIRLHQQFRPALHADGGNQFARRLLQIIQAELAETILGHGQLDVVHERLDVPVPSWIVSHLAHELLEEDAAAVLGRVGCGHNITLQHQMDEARIVLNHRRIMGAPRITLVNDLAKEMIHLER